MCWTGCESVYKHLAAKDAKSANNKNHFVFLRFFSFFAAKTFKLLVFKNTSADSVIWECGKNKLALK
jgi:hypothetical protein